MGMYDELEAMAERALTVKLQVSGAFAVVASAVFLASGRFGSAAALLMLGIVFLFFAYWRARAVRRARLPDDDQGPT